MGTRRRATTASSSHRTIEAGRAALAALSVLRPVVTGSAGRSMGRLLDLLCRRPRADARAVAAAFGALHARLLEAAELAEGEIAGDAWQNHLLERLLETPTTFSRKAERHGWAAMGAALQEQVRRDLRALQALCGLSGEMLLRVVRAAVGKAVSANAWVPWTAVRPSREDSARGAHAAMKRALLGASDWAALAEDLAGYFARQGTGLFARFRAFRWDAEGERLEGIAYPDPVRLRDLVGYDQERAPVLANTEAFLTGLPAHNVLFYGPAGTGKSSTVKALLHEYGDRGLRLVEVFKEDMRDLPHILVLVRGRRERFILFIDDLSFEEHEVHYKTLKMLLEGSLEARPDNVLVYATSNRRHLVKERFADRATPPDDEIHAQDTMEEKLSLAERFGLRVGFYTPDQARYLSIVRALAAQAGLGLSDDALVQRALLWERWQGGRSGRTARQLIDQLRAEMMARTRPRARGDGREGA
ncbi:MAG: ATP-binding protein [Armatimonadetes bacterium]|nr:ATP-binding protein [Armatimonadota bacterium]